jgi:hypothetical protein
MKLTYPTEWSNEMRPVIKFFILYLLDKKCYSDFETGVTRRM